MVDYRKLLVALVIAVLFAIFVNTSIEAISPSPQYDTFCNDAVTGTNPNMYGPPADNLTPAEKQAVDDYTAKSQKCNYDWQTAQNNHQFAVFLISAITGLIAIIIGMYVPVTSPIGMSIASGFILGGLFTLFFGTLEGWGSIARTVRPFIMLVELIVVIFVAYKQLNKPEKNHNSHHK